MTNGLHGPSKSPLEREACVRPSHPSFSSGKKGLLASLQDAPSTSMDGSCWLYRIRISQLGYTGFSSELGTKLRDWAVGQAWGSCYSWAALSSNDSKTLYNHNFTLL